MGKLSKAVLLFTFCCFLLEQDAADFIGPREVVRVQSKLRHQLGSIPIKIREVLAIFDKHMNLISCLPTKREDKCYVSPNFCNHPSLKVGGRQLKVKFGICKSPWTITIRFKLPRAPWYLKWGFEPIVLPIISNSREGVIKMKSVARGHMGFGFLRFFKAELKINGILRWDCTKPTYNKAKRVCYNTAYNDGKPGVDYNKLYYKLRVRMEVKRLRFLCFCYRCYYCRDLVNTKGHFGTGPRSCIRDVHNYYYYRVPRGRKSRRWTKC